MKSDDFEKIFSIGFFNEIRPKLKFTDNLKKN